MVRHFWQHARLHRGSTGVDDVHARRLAVKDKSIG